MWTVTVIVLAYISTVQSLRVKFYARVRVWCRRSADMLTGLSTAG